ncbi:MAG TPA: GNAT family N-acetyltransferase [Phycisphaerae bacterium]|nr:GNAT family N-acetyltransferase [Phycisphaerae bacterium]
MMTQTYPKEVKLKDGRSVLIRPLAHDDFDSLLAFFQALPEGDRIFLRHDVRDPEIVRKWTEQLDLKEVIPLVALDGDRIVGNGSLHIMPHGWMHHVGHLRLVTARSHRNKGLGGLLTRELVALAEERDLEKIQAHVIQDNQGAVKMFQAVGFETAAVLDGMVKDITGRKHNLAIMVNDVAHLRRLMEDWIQDSVLPGYRAPGAGA